ncbi:hypothetical protein WOLCODRAFT_158765 [Wolfiporia cocos MD-104 SS10]|uniref:Uncharacterized protein n=1 Tax=Wolfiporia cocos (strain MD-104) TaxID=742152 RepID=A0A2H3JRC9_WOLCO|nr:hypothetical protein WOLCODRAFT_158765 [Wolfiporia cocos MD-104 SS10]
MHKAFTEASSMLMELFAHTSSRDTFSSDDEIKFDEDSGEIIDGVDDTIGPKAKSKFRVKSTGGKKKKTVMTTKKSTMVTTGDTTSSSKTSADVVADATMDNSDEELLRVPEKQTQKRTQKNKTVITSEDESNPSASGATALNQGTMLVKSTPEPS